jgi:hypothetical protein
MRYAAWATEVTVSAVKATTEERDRNIAPLLEIGPQSRLSVKEPSGNQKITLRTDVGPKLPDGAAVNPRADLMTTRPSATLNVDDDGSPLGRIAIHC